MMFNVAAPITEEELAELSYTLERMTTVPSSPLVTTPLSAHVFVALVSSRVEPATRLTAALYVTIYAC